MGNNLVYFWDYSGWVYDCDYDKLLVISTGWLVIMIVSWGIENNLVYLKSILVYDCDYDKLLVISTGWVVIIIVSWAIGK